MRYPVIPIVVGVLAFVVARHAAADEGPVSRAEMGDAVRGYYDSEMTSSFIFVGFGAAHAGGGAIALTQKGDFAKSFGWSSVILGGLTSLGGAGYALTVAPRGKYFTSLYAKDPAKFRQEELDHISGTNGRFALYLGFEITETLAGAGVATYGFVKDKDTLKGIGLATAIQGLGLFAIDLPGALRASRYEDQVRRFNPKVAFSVGGSEGQPWMATLSQRF